MVKNKPVEQKAKAQATIKVQEVKEVETSKQEQEKPVLTVKEKIDRVVDKYEDKEELKKQIFQLVQRVFYPEQFCPKCDERMFFDPANSSYNCPNCGHQSQALPIVKMNLTTTSKPTGKVPEIVEKTISEAEESLKDVPIVPPRPTALGEKIRKLVNDRDAGGSSGPTKEDEMRVKGSDKNVANKINWV